MSALPPRPQSYVLVVGQTGRTDTGANRSLADIARPPAASWWAAAVARETNRRCGSSLQYLGTITDSDLMADGLTYELTSILATVKGLDVRSAASSFAFKGKPRHLAAVRKDLGADIVVEGELFASGTGCGSSRDW